MRVDDGHPDTGLGAAEHEIEQERGLARTGRAEDREMASQGVGRQDERTLPGVRDRDARRRSLARGASLAALVRVRGPGRRNAGRAAPRARREARGRPTAGTNRTSSLRGRSRRATAARSAARRLRRRASTAAPPRPPARGRTLRGRWSRCTCRSAASVERVGAWGIGLSATDRMRSASTIAVRTNPPIDRPMLSSPGVRRRARHQPDAKHDFRPRAGSDRAPRRDAAAPRLPRRRFAGTESGRDRVVRSRRPMAASRRFRPLRARSVRPPNGPPSRPRRRSAPGSRSASAWRLRAREGEARSAASRRGTDRRRGAAPDGAPGSARPLRRRSSCAFAGRMTSRRTSSRRTTRSYPAWRALVARGGTIERPARTNRNAPPMITSRSGGIGNGTAMAGSTPWAA